MLAVAALRCASACAPTPSRTLHVPPLLYYVYSRYSKAAIDQSNDPDSDYWVAMNKYFTVAKGAAKGAATVGT